MGTLSSCKSQLSPCQSPYPSKCTAVPWNLLGVGAGIPSLDHIYALVPSVPAAPSVSQPGQVTGSYLGLHTKGEGRERGEGGWSLRMAPDTSCVLVGLGAQTCSGVPPYQKSIVWLRNYLNRCSVQSVQKNKVPYPA